MSEDRLSYVYNPNKGEFKLTPFRKIQEGDIFTLFELDGTPSDKGTIYQATDVASYPSGGGEWFVPCEIIQGGETEPYKIAYESIEVEKDVALRSHNGE